MDSKLKLFVGLGIGFVALIILISINPFVQVSAGEKGVVLNWGAVSGQVLDEGIHWVTPISQDVVKVDTRIQKEQVGASAASKDLQVVTSEVALNFHLDGAKVNDLWQRLGKDYKAKVIDPAIQESVKSATAKYTAEELITKREAVKEEIKLSLRTKLAEDYIMVDELNIINFDFSASFNNAIEKKVTAEQDALAAKNKLEQVKYEAEQKVASAKAEAESIRLQSDAANNEKYVALKQLEVQIEYAKKWNGVLPQNVYAGAPLPILNMLGK
jgi:regulator of protease activity HflC (stomatin/prohibitin superfamily)